MKNPTKIKFMTGSILAIAAVLFLIVNISAGSLLKGLRFDLTNNKLYTLSPGTKEIVTKLSEPIVLRMYFSKKLANSNPYLISFASRVQDLLTQYQRASKGKIILEIIDPEPFSAEEDNAVNYGLQGLAVDNTGTDLYLGLVATSSVELKRVIPFLQPAREANLEYDISQLIYNLVHPQRKAVGVISALPLQGRESSPWVVWQQMAQSFDLRSFKLDVATIPNDIDVLMLVNPAAFTSDALKAVDKFVMRGGHVLAFVDPYSEVTDAQTAKANKAYKDGTADFSALLRTWGVNFAEDKVVADRTLAKPVRVQSEGRDVTVRYPLWMDFLPKNMDKNDVLTSTLDRITMATPGALSKIEGVDTTFTPLILTSADATLVESKNIPDYQQNLGNFMREYQATGPYIVAGRVSGPIKSAYGTGEVADSNIIIIADADMLYNHFWLQIQNVSGQEFGVPNSGNANFLLSALDNLAGSNALISVRNRGSFTRPFDKIQALELKSQAKYRESELGLQQQLELTKQKLVDLEKQKKDGNSMLLSVQQKKEEEAFRKELIETRRELRDVRRKLNHDIEVVQTGVKFFTIGFIPLMIVLGGLAFWGLQIQGEIRSRRALCSTPRP